VGPHSTRGRSERLGKNLVGFVVGDVRYAVDIARVREIVNPGAVVPLPQAPPAIVGVAEHRGDVLPVLDLRRRFGLDPAPPTRRTKWIVVSLGARAAAIVVDAVTEVFGVSADQARRVPETGVGEAVRGISAVYAYGGNLVFVLDVDRVAAAAHEVPADGGSRLPKVAP
jgi:purine-binding chemotaxis protein CheW